MKPINDEINNDCEEAGYGHFIDIDNNNNNNNNNIFPKPFVENYRKYKQYSYYEKDDIKNDTNEKITNYESFKKYLFSFNSICCITVSILFLNLWVFPKKHIIHSPR
jgi:hypothetical protein